MARIRSIKPEFCSSEDIVVLSKLCRLHFAMLWTYADDQGRGLDNPRLIKAALWPLDDDVTVDTIEGWQAELARHGRIVRYVFEGRRYFSVDKFKDHQKPNKPLPSKLPEPPPTGGEPLPEGYGSPTGGLPDEPVSHVEKAQGNGKNGRLPEDSGSPTGVLPPVVGVGEGVGVGVGEGVKRSSAKSSTTEPDPRAHLSAVPAPERDQPLLRYGFDEFWHRYPRKTHKDDARRAWKSVRSRGVSEVEMLEGLDRWKSYWVADGRAEGHIPEASTWLNRRDWTEPCPALAPRRKSFGEERRERNTTATETVIGEYARATGQDFDPFLPTTTELNP